jgi:dTDP-4-amino-4,6-dideoxygalactose transaminase
MNVAALSAEVRAESLEALTRVYDSGNYIQGAEVAAFEQSCTPWFGAAARCIGVSNGTDALVCALQAAGIRPGQRVLTTPLTFFATVSAICRVGAVPVFADVDAESYLMSSDNAARVAKVDAIVPVHLFGRMQDVPQLRAAHPGAVIIEDAAQAWGAAHVAGKVGTVGDAACFSFFPAKPLGACGDAGLVVTARAAIEESCRRLRAHGRVREGEFESLGGNYRLDELQAALLSVRLQRTGEWLERRRANAQVYLAELGGIAALHLPKPDTKSDRSAWSVFSVRVSERRDELRRFLAERGVGSAVYYPRPVHLQRALRDVVEVGSFPMAERLCGELLALPVGPELTRDALLYVCRTVREFFE